MFATCLTTGLFLGHDLAFAEVQAAANPAASGYAVEDLIVTARKREENVLEVPVAITSLSGLRLEAAGITSLEGLMSQVPGLVYVERQDRNSATPGIRGIRSTEIANNRQKVTTFYDGMPILGNQAISSFTDVERVEVYRGPQSAVFGRAVFAGAVNYLSGGVDYQQYTGTGAAQVTSLEGRSASMLVSGPLVEDKLAFLISGNIDRWGGPGITSSDGYALGDTSGHYVSAKLGFKPIEALEFTFRYIHSETEDGPSTLHFLDVNSPQRVLLTGANPLTNSKTVFGKVDFSIPDGYVFRRNFCFPGSTVQTGAVSNVVVANCTKDPGQSTLRNRYMGEINYSFQSGASALVKGFVSREFDQRKDDGDQSDLVPYANGARLVNPVAAPQDPTLIKERYAEVQYLTASGHRLRATLGASYYHYDFSTTIFSNRNANLIQQLFNEVTTNTGIYGSLFYDVTKKLTASLEARYQRDDITSTSQLTNKSFNSVTKKALPRFALNYKFTPDVNFYGQIAKGNNPSGINIDVLTPNKQAIASALGVKAQFDSLLTFDEESLWNYEVGVKGLFFNRRLRADLALFDMEWNNYVQPFNFAIGTAGSVPGFTLAAEYNSRVFRNSGKVQSRGVEMSGDFRITRQLSLQGAFAYTHARFKNNCSPNVVVYGLPVAQSVPITCVNVAGNSPALLPAYSGSIGASYETPIGGDWVWVNRIDINYIGRQFIDDSNLNWIGARTVMNLRTTFRHKAFQIEGAVTNVGNNKTPGTAQAVADQRVFFNNFALTGNSGNNINAPVARPREWVARVSYRF